MLVDMTNTFVAYENDSYAFLVLLTLILLLEDIQMMAKKKMVSWQYLATPVVKATLKQLNQRRHAKIFKNGKHSLDNMLRKKESQDAQNN